MSLWWLQPGWGDACCATCGTNIQSTGGDPDWGYCWPCMNRRQDEKRQMREQEREYYEAMERDAAIAAQNANDGDKGEG